MYDFKDVFNYSKDLNVLYVEDDLPTLEASKDVFESFFASVSIATNGVEGLEKYIFYKEKTLNFYDVIITDINMPKKSGLEMIRDIKKLHPQQEIVVISAYSDSDRLLELIREGISNFITKPIMPKQLIQILYKVSQNVYSEKIKNNFLIEQTKLATMGEMIDTIAHQWLGPINLIKMQVEMLEMEINDGSIKKENIKDCSNKQILQINHVVETLNEFRAFFRPSNDLNNVTYKDIVSSVLVLLKDNLLHNRVAVELNLNDNATVLIIVNEFKHVIMNIINNAIDEFKNHKIQNPKIIINSFLRDNNAVIEIIDNAGGIPKNIIDKIFEANFTTKASTKGTGIGLYLVSIILQKINAKIDVQNVVNGAKFIITIKNNDI